MLESGELAGERRVLRRDAPSVARRWRGVRLAQSRVAIAPGAA
jgi:hypothetical protein